jgi:hypothetical protein
MTPRPTPILFAGTLLIIAAGCRAPHLTAKQGASVEKWLTCDECTSGERDSVKALENEVLPRLHELLLGYPSAVEITLFKRQAQRAYQMTKPIGVSEADYIASQFGALQARRQTRAAQSLVDIHTAPARSILTYAASIANGRFRSDVASQVRFLAAAWEGPSFNGTSKREVEFGDSLVFEGGTPVLTAQALAIIDSSSPFAPESMVYRRSAGTLIVAAAAMPGQHTVAIIDGASTRTSAVNVTSDVDLNDRHTRRCATDVCRADSAEVINAGSLPALRFLSLKTVGTRIDTVDFFRIQATGAPLTVTARLDWRAPGTAPVNLNLQWRTCLGLLATGNADGSTPLNKPEVTSLTIPAGQCRMLLVTGPSQPAVPTVIARLRITSP